MKDYKILQNGSDIRGVATKGIEGQNVNLTDEAVTDLSFGFAHWLAHKIGKQISTLTIAVGRDSRISGPFILQAVETALRNRGVQVVHCDMATTPAMFMSTVFEEINADGSIMITASHLPFNRNGFKFFYKGGGLDAADVSAIIAKAKEEKTFDLDAKEVSLLKVRHSPLMDLYAAHLRKIILEGLKEFKSEKPLTGLHVVCDAGNGAGGFYALDVLKPLGADISGSQFLEPDGCFPNHEPNPENQKAMESIASAVCLVHADLGLIFDTDVDRSAAVDSSGREISRNKIVALAAALISEDYPGSTVVTDSITSDQLTNFLQTQLGLFHVRYKRGYRNVINKAIELNEQGIDCHLAIETSGHAALKENFFLDDGAYLATKIVVRAAKLKSKGESIGSMISGLVEPKEATEYRIPVNATNFVVYADEIISELSKWIGYGECSSANPCGGRCRCGMKLVTPNYEGLRVSCDAQNGDGWFLLRKSLHEPLFPLNIESNVVGGCKMIAGKIKALLSAYTELDLSVLDKEV